MYTLKNIFPRSIPIMNTNILFIFLMKGLRSDPALFESKDSDPDPELTMTMTTNVRNNVINCRNNEKVTEIQCDYVRPEVK
jgi:hypothetical protein